MDASCKIQRSIHDVRLTYKYVSRILGTYQTGATDRRIFMDQERNPNKNAELSMEQNYNQIDGIINNLPVPPPEDKPLDKVREHPPKRRSREREER